MRIQLDLNSIDDYHKLLLIKSLPRYEFQGRTAIIPDEYGHMLGLTPPPVDLPPYVPSDFLFDYQAFVSHLAIRKKKFAAFIDCGYGKTAIAGEYIKYVDQVLPEDKAILMFSPLMVIDQTIAEFKRFYGDGFEIEKLPSPSLPSWAVEGESRIAITNFEALKNRASNQNIGAIIVDESGMLAPSYGKYGQELIELGKGVEYKLCLTGTPAPNDRIEYANHAVFLDAFPTSNSFLARYFVNKGKTGERWEVRPHAVEAFYRDMSHWCIFLSNPATYGFRDNAHTIPPMHVHLHDVEMTDAQNVKARELTGSLFTNFVGGITHRSKLARIAKGGDSLKPAYIASLLKQWPTESTLIWCKFNDEQQDLYDFLKVQFQGVATITGATPYHERINIINGFKLGFIKTIVTKPEILGYGLNLQVCTRQIFSSLHDSFTKFYQAVKRSNRIGSTLPLNVHIPITEAEREMAENVFRKAQRIDHDTREQERIFKSMSLECIWGIYDAK
jgi:superfamily II DNA or RNA helicase